MKESILKLRAEGKTYKEIQEILGCSKGTISYHCGKGQKEKARKRDAKRRSTLEGKINKKCELFAYRKPKTTKGELKVCSSPELSLNNRVRKFKTKGDQSNNSPTKVIIDYVKSQSECYLTGWPIDIEKVSEYQLDHIIPQSKGGDNSVENVGVSHTLANQAKGAMSKEEFINLCLSVVKHNGYSVSRNLP